MNEESNQNLSSILNEKDVNEEKKSSNKTIYIIILTVFLTYGVTI
jgi:hypothetical protein